MHMSELGNQKQHEQHSRRHFSVQPGSPELFHMKQPLLIKTCQDLKKGPIPLRLTIASRWSTRWSTLHKNIRTQPRVTSKDVPEQGSIDDMSHANQT
jgi:hypothetical protein